MPRPASRTLSLCIGASLAALATSAGSAPVASPGDAPKANPPVVFAQAQSDLAPDPAARFGRLANGMTYVIYKNTTPPGAAAVWMRIGAGSVMEQEDQRGLAHFIEHMVFKGSTHVPEGEMIRKLERDGLQFGADTNAETEPFETTYKLNLPDASARIVSDALFLMREAAGEVSFDPAAIDRERGVILGEERVRATNELRAQEAERKALLPGAKYPERLPIGKVEVIETARHPAFLQFYHDFYRPEYATLIVVGDVDPNRVEAEIRQRFSDWSPPPPSRGALTDFGAVAPRTTPEAKVFTATGLKDTMSVTWLAPPSDTVETKAKDFDDRLWSIATGILNDRYARAAKLPDSAFTAAAFQRQDVERTAQLYVLGIRPKDGQDRAAFRQAVAMLREYLTHGPTQAELDRQLLGYERAYREGAASAATLPTGLIASTLHEAVATKGVMQSPAQGLAGFEAMKAGLTLAAIDAALARVGADGAPLLWRQGEQAAPFDETAMLAAYRAAMGVPVDAAAARSPVSWPYAPDGAPSAIVSRTELPDVGATRVTFANGVVLTVKPTHLEANAIHVAIETGDGLLGVAPDQGAILFIAKQLGLASGGLGKLSSDDLHDALMGKVYGLNFTIANTASILSGTTDAADLGLQMQLFDAFLTDPGFRPTALAQLKAVLPSSYSNLRTSPAGVYALKAAGDPYGGDPRFTTPSLQAALAVGNADVAALIRRQLGRGPLEVTVVGDITPDAAIKQVGATLGALPRLQVAASAPGADRIRFPDANLHRVYTHDGRADQNLSVIAWPTADFYSDPRRAAGLEVLGAVLTLRELSEVRQKQGATYSASANSLASRNFPGFGFITSRATVRPEADETYYQTIGAIVDDLKQHPVTDDELTRARLPLIDRIHNDRTSNAYWLALLSGSIRDPRQIATVQDHERDLLSITPTDVQTLARTYLDMSKALHIQIRNGGINS